MVGRVIDKSIFDRLYDEPTGRRAFDADGRTDVIFEQRRQSSFFGLSLSSGGAAHLLAVVG